MQADWQIGSSIKHARIEAFRGMFSRFCACISSLLIKVWGTYSAKSGAIAVRESTYFLLNQISFDLGFE